MLVSEFSELCLEAEAAGFMGKVKPGAKLITGPKDQVHVSVKYCILLPH